MSRCDCTPGYAGRCTRTGDCPRLIPPDLGKQMAQKFREYQAALNDASYWDSEDARERNKRQVEEAFDALVKLTNQILGGKA